VDSKDKTAYGEGAAGKGATSSTNSPKEEKNSPLEKEADREDQTEKKKVAARISVRHAK